MNIYGMLTELSEIAGKNDKQEYIKNNLDNDEFVTVMQFLVDKLVVSGISKKKWDKAETTRTITKFDGLDGVVEYIKENNTGKMVIVNYLKSYSDTLKSEDQVTFMKVVTKTLNLGVTKGWNKCVPSKLKTPEALYMGCQAYSEKLIDALFAKNEYILSQNKLDGQFLNVMVKDGKVVSTSARSGHPQYLSPETSFINAINNANLSGDFVINGELLLECEPNRSIANGIIRKMVDTNKKLLEAITDSEKNKIIIKFTEQKGSTPDFYQSNMIYKIWDIIPLEDYLNNTSKEEYSERFLNAERKVYLVNSDYFGLVESRKITTKKEALEHLAEELKKGKEGTVLKSPKNIFKSTKPSSQVKMKVEFNFELKIIGYKESEKIEGALGSFLCESKNGELTTGCYSGITPDQAIEFWNDRDSLVGKIIEVKGNGLSVNSKGNNSVMFPVFIDFRSDKKHANTFDEIKYIEQSALGLTEELNGNS